MRVAFVDQAGDTMGGAERSLSILLTALPPDVEPHAVLFGDGAFAEDLRTRGIPVTVVPMPPAFMATTREWPADGIVAFPRAVAATARALRTIKPDVVHTNTVKAHAVAAPAARMSGTPVVAHLRDILGGRAKLTAVADDLVDRLGADPRISHFFKETDMARLKVRLTDQFCHLAGERKSYRGANMKNAHADFAIHVADFNALVEDLQLAMDDQDIPFATQNRLLALLAPMQRDIVNH